MDIKKVRKRHDDGRIHLYVHYFDDEGVLTEERHLGVETEVNDDAKREVESFIRETGMEIERRGDGIKVTKAPSPELMQILSQFFNFQKPCWFEGCDEIRTEYKREYEQLSARMKDKCPGSNDDCIKSMLIRKYFPKVKQQIQRTKSHD